MVLGIKISGNQKDFRLCPVCIAQLSPPVRAKRTEEAPGWISQSLSASSTPA